MPHHPLQRESVSADEPSLQFITELRRARLRTRAKPPRRRAARLAVVRMDEIEEGHDDRTRSSSARPQPAHQLRDVRIGLIARPLRQRLHPVTGLDRNPRIIPQRERHRHVRPPPPVERSPTASVSIGDWTERRSRRRKPPPNRNPRVRLGAAKCARSLRLISCAHENSAARFRRGNKPTFAQNENVFVRINCRGS